MNALDRISANGKWIEFEKGLYFPIDRITSMSLTCFKREGAERVYVQFSFDTDLPRREIYFTTEEEAKGFIEKILHL